MTGGGGGGSFGVHVSAAGGAPGEGPESDRDPHATERARPGERGARSVPQGRGERVVSKPAWSILVATLARREARLRELLSDLEPQVRHARGLVEIVALRNRGERPLGHVRQALVDDARGGYLSFVDDDDRVPDYFVERVVWHLVDHVDYVGWRMQAYVGGRPLKPTFHSLRYHGWSEDAAGYYRDVSHLNPVRTELARRCDFRRAEPPEDVGWADQLRPHLAGAREAYVDEVMYRYYATGDSAWRPGSEPADAASGPPPDLDVSHFRWHPEST